MKKISLLLSLWISLHATAAFAQDDNDPAPVAIIGASVISKGEFLERYEFTPQPGKRSQSSQAGQKLKFLYTLIAEKLWAAEALNKNLDTSSAYQIAMESIENMLLRDMLWKKEITENVVISDSELKYALARHGKKLYVNFLFSESEKEIFQLYSDLKNGVRFDSLLVRRAEYDEQTLPVEVVFGQMELSVEDSLYNLKTGEFTSPILTPDGWYIFKINNWIVENISVADEDAVSSASKILIARKEQILYQKFYFDFFRSKEVRADFKLLRKLSESFSDVVTEKRYFLKIKDGDFIHVDAEIVNAVLSKLEADDLNLTFMNINGTEYSLQKYFFRIAFAGIKVYQSDIESVFQLINEKTKMFIEHELLSAEARRRNYHLTVEVKNDMNMWRDNYLFQLARIEFLDSIVVSENELKEFYDQRHKQISSPPLVNIFEILNGNLDTIAVVLNKINSGQDFKNLARKYNQREWTKKSDGEYGYFPITQFGEIGRIASALELNEVYGPIELSEGYSIIKLVGKKEPIATESKSFESVKSELKEILLREKTNGLMNYKTAALAEKYGIDIYVDAFNSIQTTEINSLVVRHLGFGGQMTAVPIVAPFDSWVEIYFRNKNKIP